MAEHDVTDIDESGGQSHPTPPNSPVDQAGPEGTREAGKTHTPTPKPAQEACKTDKGQRRNPAAQRGA